MNLVKPTIEHFQQMTAWVHTRHDVLQWAGPNARFPMTPKSLMKDFKLTELISYSLLNQNAQFVAFGQCYERLGCCHLGRLIVAPEHRGKGLVNNLIHQLSAIGCAELNTQRCSLFVFEDNAAAINAYNKCGFEVAAYPDEIPMEACLYMVKE